PVRPPVRPRLSQRRKVDPVSAESRLQGAGGRGTKAWDHMRPHVWTEGVRHRRPVSWPPRVQFLTAPETRSRMGPPFLGALMKRRTFLQLSGAAPLALRADDPVPDYTVVSAFQPAEHPGMPGPYPGQVVSVHAEKCIDAESEKVDSPTVQQMISQG